MSSDNQQPLSPRAKIMGERQKLTHEQQIIMNYVIHGGSNLQRVAGKLTRNPQEPNQGSMQGKVPHNAVVGLAGRTSNDISDIRAIQRSLPEVETAKDILVSAVLSPVDGVTEELIWRLEGDFPTSVGRALLDIIKTHFQNTRMIDDQLSTMLGNALFDRGSHILAVLPESGIDDIINSRTEAALESYQADLAQYIDDSGRMKSLGFLGNGYIHNLMEARSKQDKKKDSVKYPALESHYNDYVVQHTTPNTYDDIIPGLVRITDNFNILKMQKISAIRAKLNERKRLRPVSVAAESAIWDPDKTEKDFEALPVNSLYRRVKQYQQNGIVAMGDRSTASRKSLGHPLVVEPPHESCIPIHIPGQPENHVGYIFLLDESGNFITYNTEQSRLSHLNGAGNSNVQELGGGLSLKQGGVVHHTIQELGNLVEGPECDCGKMTLNELNTFYTAIIERDLKQRFTESILGQDVDIDTPEEIYRIMLARTLAGSMTQMLYIPASLVSYLAFYYNDFGIGESLITRVKTQAGLRIAALYANGMALVKNAVGTRQLKITPDEMTENAEELISKAVNMYIERNSMTSLFHSFDPVAIGKAMFESSIEVIVEGNDGMDQTRIETEYKSGDRPLIDTEYMDSTKNGLTDALQVPSKLFENTGDIKFSSEFISNDIFFMKRNLKRARIFNAFIRDHVEKAVLHDGELISELSTVIRENYTQLPEELIQLAVQENSTLPVIEAFFENMEVGVPLPDAKSGQSTVEAFNTYMQKVDAYLPMYVESNIVSNFISETDPSKKQEVMNDLTNILRCLFGANWINQNNAFEEFGDIFTSEGKPNAEIMKGILDTRKQYSNLVGDVLNEYYELANPQEGSGESGSPDPAPAATGEGDEFNTGSNDNQDEPPAEDNTGDEGGQEDGETKEEETDKPEEEGDKKDDESAGDAELEAALGEL